MGYEGTGDEVVGPQYVQYGQSNGQFLRSASQMPTAIANNYNFLEYAAADYNGDGLTDVIIGGSQGEWIGDAPGASFLWRSHANGTFVDSELLPLRTAVSRPCSGLPECSNVLTARRPFGTFSVADYNGDSLGDYYSRMGKMLLGKADGTFTALDVPRPYQGSSGGGLSAVAAASGDFNGDGLTDDLYLGRNNGANAEYFVWLADGAGQFTRIKAEPLVDFWEAVPVTVWDRL